MKHHCLVCEKPICAVLSDNADPFEFDKSSTPPNDATCWTSVGNYGSTILDIGPEDWFVEIVICDECLKAKQKFIHRWQRQKFPAENVYLGNTLDKGDYKWEPPPLTKEEMECFKEL